MLNQQFLERLALPLAGCSAHLLLLLRAYFFFFCLTCSWEWSSSIYTLNISSPVSAASWPFGMASWLCLFGWMYYYWLTDFPQLPACFCFSLFFQMVWCRLHLLISTVLICPPFLPEPNLGVFAQEIFSTLWQLDGKKENLWPWKMKMLPWELLILLSLKGCLAGETPSQVAFHDTPDMHTSLTGRVCLFLMHI